MDNQNMPRVTSQEANGSQETSPEQAERELFEAYAEDNGIPIPADYSDCNAEGSGWFACFKAGMQAALTRQAAPEAPTDDLDALVREYGNAPVTGPGRTRRIVMREIYHAAGTIFAATTASASTSGGQSNE